MKSIHGIWLLLIALFLVSSSARADFSKPVIKAVSELQQAVVLYNQKKMNGAEAAKIWQLFDDDVLATLNGGMETISAENLNKHYKWTDIYSVATEGDRSKIKTGGIQARFYRLHGASATTPDWLVVYYQGLGVIPSSTFHIFTYRNDRYQVGARMERTAFLNEHPNLQWRVFQTIVDKYGRHFSTYIMPIASQEQVNRSEVQWSWNRKELQALMWYPEVDYHTDKKGEVVSGRGQGFKIEKSSKGSDSPY